MTPILATRPRRRLSRIAATMSVAAILAALITAPTTAEASTTTPGPSTTAHAGRATSRIPLPDGFQPEGIAISDGAAYLGSRADGDIYRLDLATGEGRVISQGPGTPSLGMKVDRAGRLWVAGGTGGDARVVDTATGEVLASYQLVPTGTASFINDVVLTRRGAWFTDSLGAHLFEVPLAENGRGPLPAQARVREVPLTGDWTQRPGVTNANGIATVPKGQGLLVVNSATGDLVRVDDQGVATAVDLGGLRLTDGDGLLLRGRTLFVVQNRLDRVAVLRLTPTAGSGTLARTIRSADFDVPTTVARFQHRLYLPNARFTTTPTPTTPYWVTVVEGRSGHPGGTDRHG